MSTEAQAWEKAVDAIDGADTLRYPHQVLFRAEALDDLIHILSGANENDRSPNLGACILALTAEIATLSEMLNGRLQHLIEVVERNG